MSLQNVKLITSDTAANVNVNVYFIDASKGNVRLTLYDIKNTNGFNPSVTRVDNSPSNTVTIVGFSSTQTINGQSSCALTPNKNHVSLSSFGNVWYIQF